MSKKLDKIFNRAKNLFIDNNTKIVIMSDCHRGAGNNFDNFIKNKHIFEAALNYYYKNGYIYIELGDGDDLWEVKNCQDIVEVYIDVFKLLKKFYSSDRLIMIYGNHDIVKKSSDTMEKCFKKYFDNTIKQEQSLLDGLIVNDSLVLNYEKYDIFLLHGHQVDFLNGTLWCLSRFLVRYFWKVLEYVGIKDPTSAAKSYQIKKGTDTKLNIWSMKNNKIVIAGHTHRPIFSKAEEGLYFNTGSCIHPNGITCIEIENGRITLVKWEVKVNQDNIIFIGRSILGMEQIKNYFK